MKKFLSLLVATFCFVASYGQQQFEEPKLSNEFEKVNVQVGADFGIQYQHLTHSADSALIPLGSGFNLPTANFNIEALLARGIKVNLVTYLSARHHNEAWVKGGYLLIDQLPFFNSAVVDRIMSNLTFKVGEMELNYGDAHFRRSDNGRIIYNPFVGNYILDAFTTAPAFEAMYRNNGWIGMAAVTTGIVNQQIAGFNRTTKKYIKYNQYDELGFYGKIGYDKQLSSDLRVRLTLSGYHASNSHSGSLHNGDRAGSRYYLVMNKLSTKLNADGSSPAVDIKTNFMSGNWPLFNTDRENSTMVNLFTKYKGWELFGTYERVTGNLTTNANQLIDLSQVGVEGLYNFGKEEQFYLGARYNTVKDKITSGVEINRTQLVAGWRMTKNIAAKVEYVDQKYKKYTSTYGDKAGFKGMMIEAGISF